MGNEHSLSNETFMYSDLKNRLDSQQYSSGPGASITEPYTGTTVTRNVPPVSCVSDCMQQQPVDLERGANSYHQRLQHTQNRISKHQDMTQRGDNQLSLPSENTSHFTQSVTQSGDNAVGNGVSDHVLCDTNPSHAEGACSDTSELAHQPVDCKLPESMKDSGYGFMESIEGRSTDTSMNNAVHSQHEACDSQLVGLHSNGVSTTPSVRSSTSDTADRDLNVMGETITADDSLLPSNQTFESCLEMSNSSDDFGDLQRCSTSMDEHDKVPGKGAASTPSAAATQGSSHYDTVMQKRDLFTNLEPDSRSLSEESDIFVSVGPVTHPSSLELKRKSFRESKLSSPSGSPMLSRGERSRSSSIMSIDNSFETIDIDKVSKQRLSFLASSNSFGPTKAFYSYYN